MTAVRFFPVSVCVRGDTGVSDQLIIEEINRRINGDGIATYQLQALDPAQFVAPIDWSAGPAMLVTPEERRILEGARALGVAFQRDRERDTRELIADAATDPAAAGDAIGVYERIIATKPKPPAWEPPGGLHRTPRPASVLPQQPTKRKRKR